MTLGLCLTVETPIVKRCKHRETLFRITSYVLKLSDGVIRAISHDEAEQCARAREGGAGVDAPVVPDKPEKSSST